MSKKVRERREFKWWAEACAQHRVAIGDGSVPESLAFYEYVVDHLEPDTIRSAADVMSDFFSQLSTYFGNLAPGTDIPDIATIMRDHDMDPSIVADRRAVAKFMNESELLTRVPAQPQKYIRRLTNGSTSPGAQADD